MSTFRLPTFSQLSVGVLRMDDDSSGTISFNEFCGKARKFPLLLFPAFYMQDMMRKKCMGLGFWEKHTYRLRQSQKYGLEQDEDMLEVLKDIIFERKKAETVKGKKGKKTKVPKKVNVKSRDKQGRNGALPTAAEVFAGESSQFFLYLVCASGIVRSRSINHVDYLQI